MYVCPEDKTSELLLENLYILFVRTLLFSCVLLKNFIVEFEELFYFFRGDDYRRTAGDLRKHVGGLPVLARGALPLHSLQLKTIGPSSSDSGCEKL